VEVTVSYHDGYVPQWDTEEVREKARKLQEERDKDKESNENKTLKD